MKYVSLNNAAKMPILGLGTWKSPSDKAGQAVEYALSQADYEHIDCASIYRNENEIGDAFGKIFNNNIRKREEVFITSKLWNTEHKKDRVRKACEKTLKDLQIDYLDLYLMHWGVATPPNEKEETNIHGRLKEMLNENGELITENISIQETWLAMEEIVSAGLVKAIGVANFMGPMLVDLMTYAHITPAVNQIELHPYLQQTDLITFCQSKGIAVTAYSPLGSPGNYGTAKGLPVIAEDSIITSIAKTHGKSPAQILIRWGIQRNTVVIPKSTTPERIAENINVFDFELTQDEMSLIATLNRNLRFVNPSSWWKIPYFN